MRKFGALITVASLAMACGDSASPSSVSVNLPNPNDATASAPDALVVGSAAACALDLDCQSGTYCFQGICAAACSESVLCTDGQTCDARGRCIGAGSASGAPTVIPGLRLSGNTQSVYYLRPGQTSVEVTLDLNGDGPADGISYVIRRGDDEAASSVVRRMRVNGKKATFSLDAGSASPDAVEPRPVRVELLTAAGSVTLALLPESAAAGTYSGSVRINTFGASGLPIDFEIVTEPDGAALSEATSAWVVLPINENAVFSPARGEAPEEAAAQLVYDDFTQSWVANFRGAFDLTDGVVLTTQSETQIDRKIRFELTINESGDVLGQFRDIWTGLYEARSANGVISREDVIFEGSLFASKTGASRSFSEINRDATLPQPQTQALVEPNLSTCTFDLSTVVATVDAQDFDCAGISNTTDFVAASAANQARCALALAYTSLSGDTTSSQIQTYLGGGDLGVSFSEFMAQCSTGENGRCVPSNEVVCARQLLASAYRQQESDSEYVSPLLTQYQETTRERFLGAQFGSLRADTETRLEWLRSTNYPAVVTNLVRDLNERLLNEWQSDVLDVHFNVLQGQFDTAGLIALAREPEGQVGIETRGELLLEMNQNFRTALESLTIATRRWDELFTAPAKRREKAAYVASRTRDLYVIAGILKNLNSASGQGFLSAGIGSGFGALQRELGRLSLDFNQLIYARDAEVTVSTSVDPTVTNQTLLGELESKARADIATALTTVTEVINVEEAQALTETQLRNRLNNEINDIKSDLVNLCGMPLGCTVNDVLQTDECQIRVEGGECGFVYARGSQNFAPNFGASDLAASEAGAALLGLLGAANNVKIANAEVQELLSRVKVKEQQTVAFVKNIEERQQLREEQLTEMTEAFKKIAENRDDDVGGLAQNIADRAEARKEYVVGSRQALELWNGIRFGAAATQTSLEIAALTTGRIASGFEGAADGIMQAGDAFKDGLPTSLEDIPSAATRLAIGAAAVNSAAALSATAFAFETASQSLALAAEQVDRYTGAALEGMIAEADLQGEEFGFEIDAFIEAAELSGAQSEADREAIENAMELAVKERELRLAYLRDEAELQDRRSKILEELTKIAGLNLRVAQARIQYQQRLMDYGVVVQRGQLVDAKLTELVQQRQNVNLIVGSPSAVFSRANRIARAENRLESAKNSLMNWLVALEYFAVRPFMDQRIQILLARNPYQLEEIAEELLRLQAACGGSVNTFTTELSVRKDFLTVTLPQADLDGQILDPTAVFRELMKTGYVPIDKRTRYTTDANVGELMRRKEDVLAASFYVDLVDFANLAATCNAKVESVDLKLVGDIGQARPTVSLLYDGTGELRSCQPGIDAYVDQFGEGTTSFGSVTYLRSTGRSISPVAGINTFIEGSANTSLRGLPLSSQYTVLVDTKLGENSKLDWSKLEDIEIRVTYSYQDVFPEGRCE